VGLTLLVALTWEALRSRGDLAEAVLSVAIVAAMVGFLLVMVVRAVLILFRRIPPG